MDSKFDNCIEKPLGILCRCPEYQEIINKFVCYTVGTEHTLIPKMNIEPIASAKVLWIKNQLKLNEDFTKPMLLYPQEQPTANVKSINKIWVPLIADLIPLKYIKLNMLPRKLI